MVRRRNSSKYPRRVNLTFDDGTKFLNAVPLSRVLSSKTLRFNQVYHQDIYLYKNKFYNIYKEQIHKVFIDRDRAILIEKCLQSHDFLTQVFFTTSKCAIRSFTGCSKATPFFTSPLYKFQDKWEVELYLNDKIIKVNQDTTIEEYCEYMGRGEVINASTFIRRYKIC